jgi:endoglucanase
LTKEPAYLEHAIQLAPPPAAEVSWMTWHAHANAALAPFDRSAFQRLWTETERYVRHGETVGQPWQVPGRLVWASLHRWIGAAHAAERAARLAGGDERRHLLFDAMLDYTFGRNNWGVSFLFSEDLPNTVRHIYSPLYHLLGRFPTGAFSEGPGNRTTHDSLKRYFDSARERSNLPWRPELARFNTVEAVFSDDAADFMTQETTIGGQADLVLFLTLAALRE